MNCFQVLNLFYTFQFPHVFMGKDLDEGKEKIFQNALDLLEGFLTKDRYVAGDFLSLADLSILASVTTMQVLDYDFSKWPRVTEWMAMLKNQLPYFDEVNQKALDDFKAMIPYLRELRKRSDGSGKSE